MPAVSSHASPPSGAPAGATSIKISVEKPSVDAAQQIDASTLDLEDGDNRVYVPSPLKDPGTGADENGLKVTISVSGLSDSPPVPGTTATIGGYDVVCMKSEKEYAVGELVKYSAEYVLDTTA